MTQTEKPADLLTRLGELTPQELRRLLVEHLTKRKLGLTWERNAIEHDNALNADVVLPRLVPELGHRQGDADVRFVHRNLIIEGDNFDSLRLLKATHAGRIRVIYIDPPYNTGNKDWVYNDDYVGKSDRYRYSMWLEFLYQRLLLARDLLTPDGVIMVSINDENRARLELLMMKFFRAERSAHWSGARVILRVPKIETSAMFMSISLFTVTKGSPSMAPRRPRKNTGTRTMILGDLGMAIH